MIPVHQTLFASELDKTPPEALGNCWAACLASILEIDLEEVPAGLIAHDDWFERTQGFLTEGWGLTLVCFTTSVPMEGFGYSIVSGPSPRGSFQHATVYLEGELAHDPHPQGGGLVEVKDQCVFVVKDASSVVAMRETVLELVKSGFSAELLAAMALVRPKQLIRSLQRYL